MLIRTNGSIRLRSINRIPHATDPQRGDVTGVAQVLNQAQDSPFTKLDADLLTSLAGHAVIAVENAQLYDEIADSYRQTLLAMSSLLELRDQET